MWELVSWFQLEYPELVSDMRKCTHHLKEDECNLIDLEKGDLSDGDLNPYHLEGDVFCHTMMVCKQAENMPYEVQIAALLHDIGKPSTRKVNPKNGRVSFYNHDAVSAFMSLEILNREELGLSKEQKILIFNLIALHTQIYKLSVEQLASIGDLNLIDYLIRLGKADHEGRFHSHEGSEIPTIEDVMREFEFAKMKETSKEVHIMCGLPASGKSTWVDDFTKNKNLVQVISRDETIQDLKPDLPYDVAWKEVDQKKVDRLLQQRFNYNKTKDFKHIDYYVVDMTHMSKKSRKRSLSHFGSEYKKICHVFLTDLPTIHLRNSKREGKVIGKDVYEKMMRSFYPPTYAEGFDEIIYHLE